MDDQGGKIIERGLLKVYNDEAASVLSASLRHSICGTHPETGAHGEAEVSAATVGVAQLEDGLVQILIEVNDGVLKVTGTTWGLAHAASPVFVYTLSVAHTGVPRVLATANFTYFQVGIPVEFGEVRGGNSALSMQAVDVLAHDELEMVLLS